MQGDRSIAFSLAVEEPGNAVAEKVPRLRNTKLHGPRKELGCTERFVDLHDRPMKASKRLRIRGRHCEGIIILAGKCVATSEQLRKGVICA